MMNLSALPYRCVISTWLHLRCKIVTVVALLSLLMLGPVLPSVSAQGEATPAATPIPGAEGQVLIQFDAAAGELPEGVTVDAEGTVYASLSPLGQLVRVDPGEGEYEVVGTIDGLQEGDLGLIGITAHVDGSVYGGVVSSNPETHGVWRFDVDTGAVERVLGTEQVSLPNAIAFDAHGNLYVTDTIGGAVWLVPPDGTAEPWLQHALLEGDGSIGFPFPVGANGIVLDEASESVYVAVLEQGTVVSIPIEDDGSAGEPTVYAEFTDAQGPVLVDGIALDAAGNLYTAQPAVNTVVRVTPTGTIETVATDADGLDGPASVAVGQVTDGERLYISNFSVALAPLVAPDGAGPSIVMVEIGN